MARKILLADDSVTAQNMGRKILADAGYDVATVNNGSAALKRISEVKPDLIVLDVYMPGYSGLEVCQRLKDSAETAHIPVLLTVGKLEPFKPEEARRVRADAHIVKPFEASELLTAITRLEDRMVPQQADGSRFSTSVSGVERFGGDSGRVSDSSTDSDNGWKSRLRFPSKKKKEEPEPEPEPEDSAVVPFRDFRKGKGKTVPGKTVPGAPFSVNAPPSPSQEPGLVPDIPRDITPDELDALSALAAKLDGPIPEAENIAPLAEKMGPVSPPEESSAEAQPATSAPAAVRTEVEVPAPAAETKPEAKAETKKEEKTEAAPTIIEPVATTVAATPPPVETPAVAAKDSEAVEAKREAGPPIEHIEPALTSASPLADSIANTTLQSETANAQAQPETPVAVAAVTVDTAALAQAPAPVDQADEPAFAVTPGVVGPTVETTVAENKTESTPEDKTENKTKIEDKNEVQPVDVVAVLPKTAEVEAHVSAEAVTAKAAESKAEESKASKVDKPQSPEPASKQSEPQKIEQPAAVASSTPKPTEPEEPAPTDEELAEALRLLTPATGHVDASVIPSHGTLVAAGQLLAEEAARNAAAGPRWVAEPMALSTEEAAISLEAEMFHTFAASVVSAAPAVTAARVESARITGVSAIAAAVENRLAAAELASAQAAEERKPEGSSKTEEATKQVEAKTIPSEPVASAKLEAEKLEAEKKDLPVVASQEELAEEVASATFADAVGKLESEEAEQKQSEPVNSTAVVTAAAEEDNHESSPDVGGEESMGKDAKSKWHQIRTAPAAAPAGTDAVEAAKQSVSAAEETPKAMAAAAAADGSATPSADASAIASIVDSVMADLRPKIVEEIAKKLAGK